MHHESVKQLTAHRCGSQTLEWTQTRCSARSRSRYDDYDSRTVLLLGGHDRTRSMLLVLDQLHVLRISNGDQSDLAMICPGTEQYSFWLPTDRITTILWTGELRAALTL